MNIADLIARHRVLVCVGSGGVGKTSMAAAIALHGAMEGRRSMVLTIDPARRLAQSLGVGELGSLPVRVAAAHFAAAGLEPGGSLSAAMLDQKSAWDDFIRRHAPSDDVRQAILDNEFYRQLSQSFAGSVEYMAIEELCRMEESGDFDLIVLDTPPTQHALDFLEAPRRLEEFLDRSVVGWLLRPYAALGWSAWKSTSRSARFLLRRIEEATGTGTLTSISEFFVSMEGLFDGIAERSRRVRALLRSPETAFVLVAGPEEQVLDEAEELGAKMEDLGVCLKGVILNRVRGGADAGERGADGGRELDGLMARLAAEGVGGPALAWVRDTYETAERVALVEAVRREAFEAGLGHAVVTAAVPEMDGDVHSLAELAGVVAALVGREPAAGGPASSGVG